MLSRNNLWSFRKKNLPHYVPIFLIIRELKGKVMMLVLKEGLCAVRCLLFNRRPKKQAQTNHLLGWTKWQRKGVKPIPMPKVSFQGIFLTTKK
uniref:Uncharacterized protein n=1 Tax=Arundo donax TaxID=35708 RepID=A0A0A9HFC4_ARUDO